MPVDELTALGQKMRQARKNAGLTQQELSDQSHVSVKQIANIEKEKMNPSYLILRALARVLHISLDTLINPDISLDDEINNAGESWSRFGSLSEVWYAVVGNCVSKN